MSSKVQRKKVLAGAMKRLIEFHKYSRQKDWGGGTIQNFDAQRVQGELTCLFCGLYECVEVDKPSGGRLAAASSVSDDVQEILEAAKEYTIKKTHDEYAPPGTDIVLNLYPHAEEEIHEELWLSGRPIPFRISYADLNKFNKTMDYFILSLIASHNEWLELCKSGNENPEKNVQFPIVEKISTKRTEPYIGESYGYYEVKHHFKTITKYRVMAGSKSNEIYLLTTDSRDLPYDAVEREVLSAFSGVWCDLKHFAESLLVTYYDHFGSFKRVRSCRECGDLYMPVRVYPAEERFCSDHCKSQWNWKNRYSDCRRRHNESMKRHEKKSVNNLQPDFLTFDDCAIANCSDEKKDMLGFHCMIAAEKNLGYLLSIVKAKKEFPLKADMINVLKKFRK